jgi:hypothetical protein
MVYGTLSTVQIKYYGMANDEWEMGTKADSCGLFQSIALLLL